MARFYFRIGSGPLCGEAECTTDLPDLNAAWDELARTAADLLPGISRKLKPDGEWRLELLDERKKTVCRIRLVAEAVALTPH
jgi:hypothetical protein